MNIAAIFIQNNIKTIIKEIHTTFVLEELVTVRRFKTSTSYFLLTKPSKDAFLLPIIGGIEQRGSILLVTLLYDLCDGQTIFTSYLVTTNHALHRSVPLGK